MNVCDAMISVMISVYDFGKTSFASEGDIICSDVFCFRIIDELTFISVWNW